jgi:hypothetical protein
MEMVIRSSQGNLEDVMETSYRADAANQQSEPNHWTEAQQHYFRLIDGGFESLGHDAILAPCTYEESLLLNLHRFFFALLYVRKRGYRMNRKTFVRDINALARDGKIKKKVLIGGVSGTTTILKSPKRSV